jgi:hypothetical protein
VLRCARSGARPRPQRELRALERLLAPTCARARLEGQGRDSRKPRAPDPLRVCAVPATARHSTRHVRPCSPRSYAANLPPRALRARRLAVCLLRIGRESANPRSRRPEIARGHVRVGERGHFLRAVQSPKRRSSPRGDEHDAARDATSTDAGSLHSPRGGACAGSVAALLAGSRPGRCSRVTRSSFRSRYLSPDLAGSAADHAACGEAGGRAPRRGRGVVGGNIVSPEITSGTSRARRPPAPRARARPTIVHGRDP